MPTSIFDADESTFCQVSIDFEKRNLFRERRYAKDKKYEISPFIVEKAVIWRRQISIAQYMMFHVGTGFYVERKFILP